ncbi:MAG: hypothetical protein WAN74_06390 [Thermoplasmata archaeon]
MYGAARPLTSSGGTAKTLILIGLVLQLIVALIFLFGLGIAALVTLPVGIGFALAAVWLVFGLIDFLFLYLVYALCYRRTRNGEYEEAKTPTLVFGVLALIFGGVIPGILYFIAFVKLGDAAREQKRQQATGPPPAYAYPPASGVASPPSAALPRVSTGPSPSPALGASSTKFCPGCGNPFAADQMFCPSCGRPRT